MFIIQWEINKRHAGSIITTIVQNVILCMETSRDMSSLVSCLVNNCLLYARPDCTQTLLQLFFQMFKKIIQRSLLLSFITSAEEGGYVFSSVGLSVCLSVGLLANL